MGCSFAGLFAIIIFGVAVLLNIISVSLPLWSTSTIVRDTQTNLQTSDFTTGLWGFCTDFQYSSEFSDDALSFDSCYMFHTSTENELIERDNALFRVTADFSVCGAYDEYGDSVRSTAIVEGLWLAAGLDRGQFQDFLGKSCEIGRSRSASFRRLWVSWASSCSSWASRAAPTNRGGSPQANGLLVLRALAAR